MANLKEKRTIVPRKTFYFKPLITSIPDADDCIEDLYRDENYIEKLEIEKFQAKNQEEEFNLDLWIK